MRVANIVLNNFKNDSRVLKISKSINSTGAAVKVIAYHDKGMKEQEVIEGVNVNRLKLTTKEWPKNKLFQVLKYMEFIVRAYFHCRTFDVFHCNDLNSLPVGVFSKIFNKKKVVIYDAHEYETQMNGQSRLEKVLAKFFENILIKFVDEVITVSDSIADEYVRLYKIVKPTVVLNCPYISEVKKGNIYREVFDIKQEQTIFLYQGALNYGRGIEILLEAFQSMKDQSNVVVFMGYGVLESLIKDVAAISDKVFFHPAVDPTNILEHTSSADYGISFIEDTCLSYRYCLPNKLFEYTMAGIPVLSSNLPEMKKFVSTNSVGIVAKHNNIEGFKEALTSSLGLNYSELLKNVNKVKDDYSWESQEKVLLPLYRKYLTR